MAWRGFPFNSDYRVRVTRLGAGAGLVFVAGPRGYGVLRASQALGQMVLALGAAVAVLFVVSRLIRRHRGFGRAGAGVLGVVADLPVGEKERAVLVRVGTTQILLGVAPGRVTTLHVLPEPVAVVPPASNRAGAPVDAIWFKALVKGVGK